MSNKNRSTDVNDQFAPMSNAGMAAILELSQGDMYDLTSPEKKEILSRGNEFNALKCALNSW